MSWFTADDSLAHVPRRVLVAGTSGSGKTTLARRMAEVLHAPHTEIDALFHGPGWVPREDFVTDVERFSAEPRWVSEWQYDRVRSLLVERADTLVWLDLPRYIVMARIVRRTLRRRLRGEVLWNGNREAPLHTALTDPDHVVCWAWRTHQKTGEKVIAAADVHPALAVVRLRSRREVDRWLTGPLRAALGAQRVVRTSTGYRRLRF